jgi:hypothetical protein
MLLLKEQEGRAFDVIGAAAGLPAKADVSALSNAAARAIISNKLENLYRLN